MNQQLVDNNYILIPNFISAYRANKLREDFETFAQENNLAGDSQIPPSSSVHDYISFLELLTEKTPEVSEILEETVLPTYVYARVYHKGSILKHHLDRDACEISLTLHLGGDKPWDIWIATPRGEERSVLLNPGDAMMYRGTVADHWRDEYDGEKYSQVFLHYVRSRGGCSYAYFDKENGSGENKFHVSSFYESKFNEFDSSDKPKPVQEPDEPKIDTEIRLKDSSSLLRIVNPSKEKTIKTNTEVKQPMTSVISEPSIPIFIKGKSNLEDFLQIYDDVLSVEDCNKILSEYQNTDEWQESCVGKMKADGRGNVNSDIRNCTEIGMSTKEAIEINDSVRRNLDDMVFHGVKKVIDKYNKYVDTFSVDIDSGYTLLRYKTGQFYKQHVDSFIEQPRALSCSIQLNDDYEGGEFAMFNRDIMMRANVGSAIVFPSNFMYPHEIMPVTQGNRYSIITWLM